ncbi:CerR family C-terminal domain-containing protein [Castellaniella defragrans]|nr:CerR family C-terminal domain-containing protein [Castellaniella defragrans]
MPRAAGDPAGWHLAVLAAEVLAPSSHIQVLLRSEVPTKASLVMEILTEITGIPAKDPALLQCLVSVLAPCMLLQLGRRGIPGLVQAILRMPRNKVVEHLHRFAIAGLEAMGGNYRLHRPGRRKK